jgi:subtilisin family serine protease
VRFTDTVIIVPGINLARAINYAAGQGVDVISMSVGGVATPWLEEAVAHAVHEHNCIVIAAAGQPWWLMGFPAPALYDDTIAAAATTANETPWAYSERGPSVTVSAPGAAVWRAGFEVGAHGQMEQRFGPGNGTSYSAAAVAGIAALWLAHHGKQRLKVYKDHGIPLQHVFRDLLTETARVPEAWSKWQQANYGAGIVDAKALLEAPLPPPEKFTRPAWQHIPAVDALARMAQGLAAEDGPEAAAQLARASVEAALETELEDFEAIAEAFDAELMHLLAAQREQMPAAVPSTRDEALSFAAAAGTKPAVSRRLREAAGKAR